MDTTSSHGRSLCRLSLAVLLTWGALGAGSAAAAPAWLGTTDIAASGQNAVPQVAMDRGGDAVTVWSRFDGADYIVQFATRPAGGPFSTPVSLSAPGQDAVAPQVATDAAGDAVVAWSRSNGTNTIVQAVTCPAGGHCSTPTDLSAPGKDASAPAVAMDGAGDAIVGWSRSNGTNQIAQVATLAAGGSFSAPMNLSAPGQDATGVDVAMNAGGDAVAVWSRRSQIQAVRRPAGGNFSSVAVLSPNGQAGYGPVAAIGADGDAAVVWDEPTLAGVYVEGTVSDAAGTFATPGVLSGASNGGGMLRVAMDDNGEAVAVWEQWTGGGMSTSTIQASVRLPGGAFSPGTDISAAGPIEPQLAMNAMGDTIVMWTGANLDVEAVTRTAGGSFSVPVQVTPAGQQDNAPAIALDPAGDALAVFKAQDDPNLVIRTAAYDATAPTFGSISVPGVADAGTAVSMSASATDVSGPVTLSYDFGDGTTAGGASVSHTYAVAGQYQVSVTATDPAGNRSTATRTINVTGTVSPSGSTAAGSSSGSGATGEAHSQSPATTTGAPQTIGSITTPSTPRVVVLTRAQKLAAAISACQKLKKPKRRAACVSAARKRYGPKKRAKKTQVY